MRVFKKGVEELAQEADVSVETEYTRCSFIHSTELV